MSLWPVNLGIQSAVTIFDAIGGKGDGVTKNELNQWSNAVINYLPKADSRDVNLLIGLIGFFQNSAQGFDWMDLDGNSKVNTYEMLLSTAILDGDISTVTKRDYELLLAGDKPNPAPAPTPTPTPTPAPAPSSTITDVLSMFDEIDTKAELKDVADGKNDEYKTNKLKAAAQLVHDNFDDLPTDAPLREILAFARYADGKADDLTDADLMAVTDLPHSRALLEAARRTRTALGRGDDDLNDIYTNGTLDTVLFNWVVQFNQAQNEDAATDRITKAQILDFAKHVKGLTADNDGKVDIYGTKLSASQTSNMFDLLKLFYGYTETIGNGSRILTTGEFDAFVGANNDTDLNLADFQALNLTDAQKTAVQTRLDEFTTQLNA